MQGIVSCHPKCSLKWSIHRSLLHAGGCSGVFIRRPLLGDASHFMCVFLGPPVIIWASLLHNFCLIIGTLAMVQRMFSIVTVISVHVLCIHIIAPLFVCFPLWHLLLLTEDYGQESYYRFSRTKWRPGPQKLKAAYKSETVWRIK